MVTSVPEFYAGQKILVTGGSGFMGKVLIEKLLRSCPDVDTIYMIIRPKKGKSIEERWAAMKEIPLFEKVKSMRPGCLDKVQLIPGELSRDDLGISEEDKKTLEGNVTIAFHVAADVQFTESINDALVQNVKATKVFLDFLVKFKGIKAFVYISTAYCNFDRPPSESVEKILPACQDWRHLLKLQETQPMILQQLKEKLLCGHPNPYTWSKSLAEQIVDEYSSYFPTAVIRPAIVGGCIRDDPLVGWADSFNGLAAIGIGAYTGILRIFKSTKDCFLDYVPVDVATRAELVAAKKAAETGTRLAVYNCSTASVHAVTMETLWEYEKEITRRYPIPQKIWATSLLLTTNEWFFGLMFLWRQVLPALFLDLCLKMAGRKPMFKKIAIKVANSNRMFGKFSSMKILFPIENSLELEDSVSKEDKEDFSLDVKEFIPVCEEVFMNMTYGIMKYYLKLDMSEETLKKNGKRLKKILLFRKVLKTIQYAFCGFILYNTLEYIAWKSYYRAIA